MVRISLVRPAAHTVRQMECDRAAIYVAQFPLHETTVSREGQDLVFAFGDGAAVRLHDFYAVYDKAHMPQFELDGEAVDGNVFLAALEGESLETALGPAAARHHGQVLDGADGDLMGGLGRLGGLDWQMAGSEATSESMENDLAASLLATGQMQEVGNASLAMPANPLPEPSPTPGPEPAKDLEPDPHGGDGDHGLFLRANGIMQVKEASLPQGTAPDARALAVSGSMSVISAQSQGGVQSVSFCIAGGEPVTVFDATSGLVSSQALVTANGTLVCTAFTDNVLHYTYTLTHPASHSAGDGTMTLDDFTVTVTATDGTQANGTVAVHIVDDAPVLHVGAASGTLVDLGADRLDAVISWGNLEFVDTNGHQCGRIFANGEAVTLQTPVLGVVVGQTSHGPAFVLAANPADGSFVFEQYATLDSVSTHSQALAECRLEPVASGVYRNGVLCTGDEVSVAIHATGGEKVNVSARGIGVHNNRLDPGETLIFDMTGEQAVTDFSFGYGSKGNQTGIADVTVTFRDGTDFHFVTGNQPSAGPFVLSGQEGYPAGQEIVSVAVTGLESGKILLNSVYASTTEQVHDVSLVANFTAIDGDGDQVEGSLPLALNECITPVADGILPQLLASDDAPQAILGSLQSVLQDEQLASLPTSAPDAEGQGVAGDASQAGDGDVTLPRPAFLLVTDELNARFDALLDGGHGHDVWHGTTGPSLGSGNSLTDCDSLAANLGLDPHGGASSEASMVPQVDALLSGHTESLLTQPVDGEQETDPAEQARRMLELAGND